MSSFELSHEVRRALRENRASATMPRRRDTWLQSRNKLEGVPSGELLSPRQGNKARQPAPKSQSVDRHRSNSCGSLRHAEHDSHTQTPSSKRQNQTAEASESRSWTKLKRKIGRKRQQDSAHVICATTNDDSLSDGDGSDTWYLAPRRARSAKSFSVRSCITLPLDSDQVCRWRFWEKILISQVSCLCSN